MKAPRRTIAPGTARKPAASNCGRVPAGELGRRPCPTRARARRAAEAGPARITSLGLRRKDSSTAFFSPLVDRPSRRPRLLGHAQLAGVEQRRWSPRPPSRIGPWVVGRERRRGPPRRPRSRSCRSASVASSVMRRLLDSARAPGTARARRCGGRRRGRSRRSACGPTSTVVMPRRGGRREVASRGPRRRRSRAGRSRARRSGARRSPDRAWA